MYEEKLLFLPKTLVSLFSNRIQRSKVRLYTTTHLFEAIKNIVADLKTHNPGIERALDVPAGAGALTHFLQKELSLSAFASDIDLAKWELSDLKPEQADLGRQLPYESKFFDLVVCMEGIKHVGDVQTAIREMSRVLKPNGFLVLSLSNDLCIQTRLRYFFDAHVDTDWDQIPASNHEFEMNHLSVNSSVQLPFLYSVLERNRLNLIECKASRYRASSVALAILFYPLFNLLQKMKYPKDHALRQQLSSMTWLAGRHCILICQKRK